MDHEAGSSASGFEVVAAFHIGSMDSEKRATGWQCLGCGGSGSCHGGLIWWEQVEWCGDDFGRKPSASALPVAMSMGVITLLWAPVTPPH